MKHLLELIKKYEGCHKRQADGTLIAYKCPAGVWTIGWGTTGRYVREGTVWTQEKADERLVKDAQAAIDAALKASPILQGADYKLAAIADFVYNLGIGNYQSSTLKKRVDAGNWLEASQEIRRWNKAGGKVLAGLTAKGRAKYNRETGSNLKPPAPNPKTKKDKARRESFCARMSGMPGPMKDEKGRPTRKAASLKRWNCPE